MEHVLPVRGMGLCPRRVASEGRVMSGHISSYRCLFTIVYNSKDCSNFTRHFRETVTNVGFCMTFNPGTIYF